MREPDAPRLLLHLTNKETSARLDGSLATAHAGLEHVELAVPRYKLNSLVTSHLLKLFPESVTRCG